MNTTFRALCLLSLAGCAGTARVPDAPAAPPPEAARAPLVADASRASLEREAEPAVDPVPAEPAAPVAIGSEYEDNQGGSWLPPELEALVTALEAGAGRPTRVTWIGGSADRCDELWRFRLVYGSYERFANVSGFRTPRAAAACGEGITERFGDGPGNVNHAAGALLVVFNREVTAAQRAALVDALDGLDAVSASPVPPRVLPAGAAPGLYQRTRHRPPPPKRAGR